MCVCVGWGVGWGVGGLCVSIQSVLLTCWLDPFFLIVTDDMPTYFNGVPLNVIH